MHHYETEREDEDFVVYKCSLSGRVKIATFHGGKKDVENCLAEIRALSYAIQLSLKVAERMLS